jgi:hypothetical protein
METLRLQVLADEIYEMGIGTITVIEQLILLLEANGVSETDIRQSFGLLEEQE